MLKSWQLATIGLSPHILFTISLMDIVISCAVSAAIVLIGQAIVQFEVFTGKLLPQRRSIRHWRNIITLAVAYSAIMSGALQLSVHPIYSLLLVAMLLTLCYAMFTRASTVERQRYIRDLRPFVLSQRLYDNLIRGAVPTEVDVITPFHALCQQILSAHVAYLVPTGPLASLIGKGLTFPGNDSPPRVSVSDFSAVHVMCIDVDPLRYAGASWAVPLWSERGLIGVFLLGEKENGGLYTQEEIEIARSTGERLIDTQASAEMARRLMGLQRQRLTESQVIDRRTRRTLHDDILPRLHAAMLTVSAQPCGAEQAAANDQPLELVQMLADIHHQIADLLLEMPTKIAPEISREGLIGALREVISGELATAFDKADWEIDADVDREIPNIPLLMSEVIFYAAREAVRNAARHARGRDADRCLQLRVRVACRDGLELLVEDNGIGFEPTRQSGHGLALHSTMMAVIGGTLSIESIPNQLTRVALTLPREAW